MTTSSERKPETLTEFFARLNTEYDDEGIEAEELTVGEVAEWIRADRHGAEWKQVADGLAAALRGWEALDKACDEASGSLNDPVVVAAAERLDATFEQVWAARDEALADYDKLSGLAVSLLEKDGDQ